MTKKTIFLHVGYHKTGTTFIQYALMMNAAVLAQQGLLYYQDSKYADQWYRNHTLALSILKKRHDTITFTEPPDQVWSRFLQAVSSFSGKYILVSSEVFLEGVDKDFIKKKLADYSVKLIFYVREQSRVIGSLYTEKLKHGYADNVDTYFEQHKDTSLDYYSELENWATLFGKDNIIVRDFSRITRQGNLLQDFLGLLDVTNEQIAQLKIPQDNINIRYPAQLVDLLLAFNKLPISINEKMKFRYYLDSLLNNRADIASMPRFEVNEKLRTKVFEYSQRSNKLLSEQYATEGKVFFV